MCAAVRPRLPYPRVRLVLASVASVAGVTAAFASWLEPRPDLDANDAERFALDALAAAGVNGARSVAPPEAGTFPPAYEVWLVQAEVEGGHVSLRVDRDEAQAIWLTDEATAGGPLLTDEQVVTLDRYDHDAVLDDRRDRNVLASAAGALVGVVAVLHADRARRQLGIRGLKIA